MPREKSALHRFRNAARKTWNHGSFLHEMSFAIARHAIHVHDGGSSKAADVLLGEVKMPGTCYGCGEAPFRRRPRSRSGTRCGVGLGSGVESKESWLQLKPHQTNSVSPHSVPSFANAGASRNSWLQQNPHQPDFLFRPIPCLHSPTACSGPHGNQFPARCATSTGRW